MNDATRNAEFKRRYDALIADLKPVLQKHNVSITDLEDNGLLNEPTDEITTIVELEKFYDGTDIRQVFIDALPEDRQDLIPFRSSDIMM